MLTGQTRHRDKVIDEFTSGNTSVFLISLKAGGTGFNLTQADTVIHFDPWWNPAVENKPPIVLIELDKQPSVCL